MFVASSGRSWPISDQEIHPLLWQPESGDDAAEYNSSRDCQIHQWSRGFV